MCQKARLYGTCGFVYNTMKTRMSQCDLGKKANLIMPFHFGTDWMKTQER